MRIRGLERNEASWLIRWTYGAMKRRFGKVLTPQTVWAHRPGTMLTLALFMQTAEASKIVDPAIRSLASLRAAQLIGCPF